MHAAARSFVALVAGRRPPGLVLDIGGRDVNGSVRDLFAGDPYLTIDLRDGDGVDVVADGVTFTPDIAPACVVCCEVFEHTPDAARICAHVFDILAPGGVVIVTAAGPFRPPHSGIDGGPLRAGEWYRNLDVADLADWLARFELLSLVDAPGPRDVYAFAKKGTGAPCGSC
jgi:SAM-dependent methyltransferase